MSYQNEKEVRKDKQGLYVAADSQKNEQNTAAFSVKADVKNKAKVITVEREEEEADNIIKLSQPYIFEGETITEIDLTGLEDVTALQMQKAENKYRKITKNISSTPELTLDYAIAMAHTLTGLPIEFLQRISGKDATKIKSRVINFLYSVE